jgi:CHASE2 domain-containing sensor protein
MIGGFGFFIGLLPSLIGRRKPERSSGIITGSILLIFGVVYATLGLWLAFTSTMLVSIGWFILAIQVTRRINCKN